MQRHDLRGADADVIVFDADRFTPPSLLTPGTVDRPQIACVQDNP
jgi:hypothetical protein